MYKLTEKRLSIAEPILTKYGSVLTSKRSFDAGSFEQELRKALDLGYSEFKDIMCDVFDKHPRYRRVTAYYMQHSNAPGPVSEYKPLLAKLYGLEGYDAPERKEKQQKYWARKR
jgi:hypothetical protein